jgi:NADH-quinone oxidoreductase subunit N
VLYVTANLGAFAAVSAAGVTRIDDFRGLARRSPLLAAALTLFLLGLAGLPPTLAGLVAKVVVLRAALLGGAGWLAVAVAVNTVIGLAYYLRLVAIAYRDADTDRVPVRRRTAPSLVAAVAAAAAVTVLLSLAPQIALGLTR